MFYQKGRIIIGRIATTFCFALTLITVVPRRGRAQSDTPRTISHQGYLTDSSSGDPVPDATYQITFRIYATDSGGSALWTETQNLQTSNGVFDAVLGSVAPLWLQFNRPLWLSVQVDPDPEMTQRTELTSVPYALGLALPFNDTLASGAPLIHLNNSGNSDGILVTNSGSGTAGAFIQENAGSDNTGVYAASHGTGPAVFGQHLGTGNAGRFVVENGSSTAAALYAETKGDGPAAYFKGVVRADSVVYNAPLHSWSSVNASAFSPHQQDGTIEWVRGDGFWVEGGTDFSARASIQLPNHAVLETLSCRLVDFTESENLICRLCEEDGFSACQPMGGDATSSGSGGFNTYTASLDATVVDNQSHSYYVYVQTEGPTNWAIYNQDLRVLGVSVGYTVGGAP